MAARADINAAAFAAAHAEFDAEVDYLDTATMGLPPRRSWTALQGALAHWRSGTSIITTFDTAVADARAAYAHLVGVDASAVAVGSQVSVFAGLVAANLPDNSEVLVATGDFTSILYPFLVQAERGISVREVPLQRLAESVTSRTTLIAVSAVQSADGALVDLDELRAASEAHGAQILLDTTQAVGWLPVDASRYAYTVCGGYKWLLSPRGTAYLTVQTALLPTLTPHLAGWYAGESPWSSIYGTTLRLASDARRFDVSPAWHSWVGAAPSLGCSPNSAPRASMPTLSIWPTASGSASDSTRRTRRSCRCASDQMPPSRWPARASPRHCAPSGFDCRSTSASMRSRSITRSASFVPTCNRRCRRRLAAALPDVADRCAVGRRPAR
ncbi:MAG TPA: aminotransferase class V-fold PLP-dependent enzyme [Jatrophihabitans sp.]